MINLLYTLFLCIPNLQHSEAQTLPIAQLILLSSSVVSGGCPGGTCPAPVNTAQYRLATVTPVPSVTYIQQAPAQYKRTIFGRIVPVKSGGIFQPVRARGKCMKGGCK